MQFPFVADRQSVIEADALIADYGNQAADEAANRAADSRERGNVLMFCRWRQIERLIAMLSDPDARDTVH